MSCFLVKKIEAVGGDVTLSTIGYITSSDESGFINIHGSPFTNWVSDNPLLPQADYFDTNSPCYVLDTCAGAGMEGLSLITDLNNPEGI